MSGIRQRFGGKKQPVTNALLMPPLSVGGSSIGGQSPPTDRQGISPPPSSSNNHETTSNGGVFSYGTSGEIVGLRPEGKQQQQQQRSSTSRSPEQHNSLITPPPLPHAGGKKLVSLGRETTASRPSSKGQEIIAGGGSRGGGRINDKRKTPEKQQTAGQQKSRNSARRQQPLSSSQPVDLSSFRVTSPTSGMLSSDDEGESHGAGPDRGPLAVASTPKGHHRNRKTEEDENSFSDGSGDDNGEEPPEEKDDEEDDEPLDQLADMRCPICIEPFTKPVTLPCGHHVCHGHIEDMKLFSNHQSSEKTMEGDEAFSVTCPKCREVCHYKSMDQITVNKEMQSLVQMMVKLIQKTAKLEQKQRAVEEKEKRKKIITDHKKVVKNSKQQGKDKKVRKQLSKAAVEIQSEGGAGPDEDGGYESSAPAGQDGGGGYSESDGEGVASRASSKTSKTSKRSRVRFHEHDEVVEAQTTFREPSESPSTSDQQAKSEGASNELSRALEQDSTERRLRAQQRQQERLRLEELEKELETQRKSMKDEKERQHRQRTAEWKQRVEADDRRRLLQEQGILPPEVSEEDSSFSAMMDPSNGGVFTEEEYRKKEQEFMQLKKIREDQREADRAEKEQQLRSNIQNWMSSAPGAQNKTDEVAKQLQTLQDFIKDMENPSSPTKPARGGGGKNDPVVDHGIDYEVEAAMLQIERRVMREHEEELSNSEKAAIAEQRARGYIDAFKARQGISSAGKRPPPKPTFIPKLHRLKKI